jgi:four helix bundle protein
LAFGSLKKNIINIKMKNFRKLNIWQQGIILVKEIYKLSTLLPKEEKYGLKSQICRAAVSVPSNIAEGCSRNSEKEFKRFLEISIGSSFELETQLIIIQKLQFISEEILKSVFELLNKEQKMINNLINKLKANSQ